MLRNSSTKLRGRGIAHSRLLLLKNEPFVTGNEQAVALSCMFNEQNTFIAEQFFGTKHADIRRRRGMVFGWLFRGVSSHVSGAFGESLTSIFNEIQSHLRTQIYQNHGPCQRRTTAAAKFTLQNTMLFDT